MFLEVLQAPKITGLEDEQVDEGEDALFKARVSGKPEPTTTWKHSGSVVTTSEKYHVEQEGEVTEMRIRGCRESDSGQILLTATNKAGTDEARATLTVRGKKLFIIYRTLTVEC